MTDLNCHLCDCEYECRLCDAINRQIPIIFDLLIDLPHGLGPFEYFVYVVFVQIIISSFINARLHVK